MVSTYSDRYKLELIGSGDLDGTWGTNTNTNLETIDAFTAGYINKDVGGSANVTLTTANASPTSESSNKVVELSGTLTGNIHVFIPAVENNYIVFNNTSGSFTVDIAPTGHAANSFQIVQGSHTIIYCTGDAVKELFANSIGTFSAKESLTVNNVVMTASNGDISATSYTGNGAGMSGVSSIPSGTTALFYQSSAPTGWTQNTNSSLNETCLRVVTGSGGGTGGTDTATTVFGASKTTASQTLPFTINNPGTLSGSLGDTSVSTPQIASHNHSVTGQSGSGIGQNRPRGGPVPITYSPSSTGSTGGGGAHNHPLSGSFTATGTADSDSSSLTLSDMDLKLLDIIACTKD